MAAFPAQRRASLRVCADPNNLPFSNERGEGFENKTRRARRTTNSGLTVDYTWWAQRRGFLRNTLKAEPLRSRAWACPSNMEGVRTTAPYYRSTYVFVTRADGPGITSFDDPGCAT